MYSCTNLPNSTEHRVDNGTSESDALFYSVTPSGIRAAVLGLDHAPSTPHQVVHQ